MAGDMKLTDVVLKNYVAGTLDELDKKCAADAAACDNVAITDEQEQVLAYVLNDGAITGREKVLLSFLPSSVVNGIAGDDGKKPARMKAEALVKKLAAAKPEEIAKIADELRTLDPVTRFTVEPEVRKMLAKVEKEKASFEVQKAQHDRANSQKFEMLKVQYEALETRIENAEEKYDELKNAGYRRIGNMGLNSDGVVYQSMMAGHEREMAAYYSANIQPMNDQAERLRRQIDQLSESDTSSPDFGSAASGLRAYLDGAPVHGSAAPRAVLQMLSIDELEQEVRAEKGSAALLMMIERFPGEDKTSMLCQEAIRQLKDVKDQNALTRNAAVAKLIDYIGNFRSRLEPVINDIPEVLLPALLAAHPEENVSDLVIARIMGDVMMDREQKLKVFAAAAEKADAVTFDRMVAAVKALGAGGEFQEFQRLSERYAKRVAIESSISNSMRNTVDSSMSDARHYRNMLMGLSDYVRCRAGQYGIQHYSDRWYADGDYKWRDETISSEDCDDASKYRRGRYSEKDVRDPDVAMLRYRTHEAVYRATGYNGELKYSGDVMLSDQQRRQIRTAMEQGATELFLGADGTIAWK